MAPENLEMRFTFRTILPGFWLAKALLWLRLPSLAVKVPLLWLRVSDFPGVQLGELHNLQTLHGHRPEGR